MESFLTGSVLIKYYSCFILIVVFNLLLYWQRVEFDDLIKLKEYDVLFLF